MNGIHICTVSKNLEAVPRTSHTSPTSCTVPKSNQQPFRRLELHIAGLCNTQHTGDTRPTSLQIIKDENLEGKLQGKVIVITGTSSGIGIETAKALATTGATLFLIARSLKKAQDALASIISPNITLVEMDNTSFDSVRTASFTILQKSNNQVNILINNAGIMAVPTLELTKDGHESQFATNHLSHFLLFQLLKPALLASASPDFHSRVVNVASSGHRIHEIMDSDNYDFQKGGYDTWVAYGQSKLANVYMANEIDRRYGSKGLHATSLNTRGIDTGLKKHIDPVLIQHFYANEEKTKKLKSPEQGAATTVLAAVGKEWENNGGRYAVILQIYHEDLGLMLISSQIP